ncbi:ABC transporter ATP-binding protein [Schaalia sp. Marseille-Q2122]|uniref:ABC transporter ATP-binding protein n=1 Tax=Schaalia sp. Marseille-Q2122 TaxID=2736604 RepID=UPI0034C5B940
MTMIEFRSVSKTYPGGVVAVRDFSLTIHSGRSVAFLGSSGSGKTTLLRMVNRMVDPTSGTVLIEGDDVLTRNAVELRRSIGYVLQAGGLMPHRTVADNIATVPILNGIPRRQARATACELLERVGLDPALAQRYPFELSGGQQQRVGVARALAGDPKILLMDEPFGAVDPIVRRELQDELIRLQDEIGKTMIFVTHDVDEAFRVADEVVVLQEGGQIAQYGTPEEIVASPANEFVEKFIGACQSERQLEIKLLNGRNVVLDAAGTPLGVVKGAPTLDRQGAL